MSPQVKLCRNLVAAMGIMVLVSGIVLTAEKIIPWRDGLEMLGVVVLCSAIVREVNRGEGRWHEEAFGKPQPVERDQSAEPENNREVTVNDRT